MGMGFQTFENMRPHWFHKPLFLGDYKCRKTKQKTLWAKKFNFLLHVLLKFIYYFVIEIRCNKLYLPIKISRWKSSNLRINLFGLDVLLLYKIWIYEKCRRGPNLQSNAGALCNFFLHERLSLSNLPETASNYYLSSFIFFRIYLRNK